MTATEEMTGGVEVTTTEGMTAGVAVMTTTEEMTVGLHLFQQMKSLLPYNRKRQVKMKV